jgi:hypothetical protein
MCTSSGKCLVHDPFAVRRDYYRWAAEHARRQAAWHRRQAKRRPEAADAQGRLAEDYEDGALLYEALLADLTEGNRCEPCSTES